MAESITSNHAALYVPSAAVVPVEGIALDPDQTTLHIALSGGNLIATATAGVLSGDQSRATFGGDNRRYYCEATITNDLSGTANIGIGVANEDWVPGSTYLGGAAGSLGAYISNLAYVNGTPYGSWGTTPPVQGDTIQMATDLKTPRKIWFRRIGDTLWNGTGAPNGSGGIDIGFTGITYPFVDMESGVNAAWTFNFGGNPAIPYLGAIPEGYTSWGDLPPPATIIWDDSTSTSELTFSGGGRVATASGSITADGVCRSDTGHSTGKWYVKLYYSSRTASTGIGLINSSFSIGSIYVGGNSASVAAYDTGPIYSSGATIANWTGTPATTGHTVEMAINLDSSSVWWRLEGVDDWNDNPSADPATGVGGYSIASLMAGAPIYVALDFGAGSTGSAWTIIDGNPPGGGFNQW